MDEGLAALAMWLFGNPDYISGFNNAPDNDLTDWSGTWADYIQTYLWTLYFFEQYGGHPSIFAVVNEAENSIAGYDQVLDDFGYTEDVTDVFADWAVANFLDDITLEDGRFGYTGDDLPPFNVMGTYSTYPVTNVYKTVKHWATDYYRFQNFEFFETLLLSFDGNDSNDFAVWGLAIYGSDTTEVLRMTLDGSTQAGTLEIPGLTDPADQVILVVASVSSTGGMDYIFSAGDIQGIEVETPAAQMLSIHATPNPFRTTVTLHLNWTGISDDPTVDIFDINGRLIRQLSTEAISEGRAIVIWNGCMEDGNPASPGIYFARGGSGSADSVTNLLLLP
ncbi:MAG: FlgD immunoglobulin-like domain containing protein [Candidatus Fermentibacteria bacterium]